MALVQSTLSRRVFLGLLGSTALVRIAGQPGMARAATAPTFRAPPLMTDAPSQGPGQFSGTAWPEYTDSFSDFVTTYEANPISRERPPLGLAPDDYQKVNKFYAVSPKSRSGVEVTATDGAVTQLWAPAYTDMHVAETSTLRAVGPTMEFTRGQITGVWMRNLLEVCGTNPSIEPTATDAGYTPHNFDYTNLHTHGLHVSPRAPSDDVLVTVVPDQIKDICTTHPDAITAKDPATFPYFYDIPESHPIGTFWYHPHMHGSVAAQVGPGMSGALLIRSGAGEIDFDEALEIACGITRDDERVMVLQHIDYSAPQAGTPDTGIYVATNTYNGPEQDFSCTPSVAPNAPSFDVGKPVTTKTSVNGIVNPSLEMQPGEILRFRMVNATNGNTYIPKFVAAADAPAGQALPEVYAVMVDGIPIYAINSADDPDGTFGPDTPYFQIDYDQARPADGDNSMAARKYWTTAELITLAPAQRLDILVKAPAIPDGDTVTFTLVGAAQVGADGKPSATAPNVMDNEGANKANTDPIVTVQVTGTPRSGQSVPTMSFFEVDSLRQNRGLANANLTRPELPVASQPSSLSVGEMTELWFANYLLSEQDGAETPIAHPNWKSLNFAYVQDPSKDATQANFQINGQSFDANLRDAPQLDIPIDGWTSWELFSSNDMHMFHIHINSFMILGRYTVAENTPADATFNSYLMPIWRDTAYFDAAGNETATSFDPNSTVGRRIAALSYQIDYTGEFVFHCHSLYHEDNGMMFTVMIS
ncbi:MAG: multicopper oxidase domain-containing protein [Pseudomonadota bacterium]